jgi:ribosomal protein L37E
MKDYGDPQNDSGILCPECGEATIQDGWCPMCGYVDEPEPESYND